MRARLITVGLVGPRILARYAHEPNFPEIAPVTLPARSAPLAIGCRRCRRDRRRAAATGASFDCICTCERCGRECVALKTKEVS